MCVWSASDEWNGMPVARPAAIGSLVSNCNASTTFHSIWYNLPIYEERTIVWLWRWQSKRCQFAGLTSHPSSDAHATGRPAIDDVDMKQPSGLLGQMHASYRRKKRNNSIDYFSQEKYACNFTVKEKKKKTNEVRNWQEKYNNNKTVGNNIWCIYYLLHSFIYKKKLLKRQFNHRFTLWL